MLLAWEYFWRFRISWNLPLLLQEKPSEDGRLHDQPGIRNVTGLGILLAFQDFLESPAPVLGKTLKTGEFPARKSKPH
jgi:hypothetical protein